MTLSEEEITRLEAQIPELSRKAFREAFQKALDSGHPVTILDGDEVVQISSNGERRVIEHLTTTGAYFSVGKSRKQGQAWPGHVQ